MSSDLLSLGSSKGGGFRSTARGATLPAAIALVLTEIFRLQESSKKFLHFGASVRRMLRSARQNGNLAQLPLMARRKAEGRTGNASPCFDALARSKEFLSGCSEQLQAASNARPPHGLEHNIK